jgi:hypothetical protein
MMDSNRIFQIVAEYVAATGKTSEDYAALLAWVADTYGPDTAEAIDARCAAEPL